MRGAEGVTAMNRSWHLMTRHVVREALVQDRARFSHFARCTRCVCDTTIIESYALDFSRCLTDYHR